MLIGISAIERKQHEETNITYVFQIFKDSTTRLEIHLFEKELSNNKKMAVSIAQQARLVILVTNFGVLGGSLTVPSTSIARVRFALEVIAVWLVESLLFEMT
ncbi:MAG TPA: hypothetical protein VEH06_01295 [Candidatus Bathyarchaeia archaeon]|nr:hypothetical protein [Candidatus Bathyarchaeia archaeon]